MYIANTYTQIYVQIVFSVKCARMSPFKMDIQLCLAQRRFVLLKVETTKDGKIGDGSH